jgi:tRNA nucleotidyltransferase (CCA-adding enzyme)
MAVDCRTLRGVPVDGPQLLERLAELPHGRAVLDAPRAGVHLVGGAVRDLALGRAPREIDLVVEGDPEPLIEALGGAQTEHERFGTTVVAGVDVVRARVETYPQPGALPEVRAGSLDEDLRRRDFTVNAIAVALADGEVHAVERADEDLAARVLRVLHDGSFRDDPTRLWRLARYGARLGFAAEERTLQLASEAVADGAPQTVSGVRMGNELRLALREPDPVAALVEAAALGLLPAGFVPVRADEALALLPPGEARADLALLAACCAGMDARALLAWLDHMGFPGDERDLVAAASRFVTGAPLRAARTPSEIARAARGAPLEAVALAGGDNARRWIDELRHVQLHISGDDLLAAGVPQGPEIGERLRRTLDRVLDGEIAPGRESELAAALE